MSGNVVILLLPPCISLPIMCLLASCMRVGSCSGSVRVCAVLSLGSLSILVPFIIFLQWQNVWCNPQKLCSPRGGCYTGCSGLAGCTQQHKGPKICRGSSSSRVGAGCWVVLPKMRASSHC